MPIMLWDEQKKAKTLDDIERGELYPLTIVRDPYTGLYSGATWVALHQYPEFVPDEITGQENEHATFWRTLDLLANPVGKGDTPERAVQNLYAELKRFCER